MAHDPDPLSLVRGANVVSTHHERPSGVPESFQTFEDNVGPTSSQSRDIFSEYPTRPDKLNDSEHFEPEARPRTFEARAFAGARDVLTGEAAGDGVDSSQSENSGRCNISHVLKDRNAGEILPQNRAGKRFDFDESHGFKPACPVQAQGDAANSAETNPERGAC